MDNKEITQMALDNLNRRAREDAICRAEDCLSSIAYCQKQIDGLQARIVEFQAKLKAVSYTPITLPE